jgi:hypothetical protein
LGLGLGLRGPHVEHIREHRPAVDWFEILTENYLGRGGKPLRELDEIAEHYPIVLHGVSMSLGSTAPLDREFFAEVRKLADRVRAVWLGDHVCWTGTHGVNTHDLLPLPYNEDTLKHLVQRIRTVQDLLERPLVLENPSTYLTFRTSTMSEAGFLRAMAEEADCALLLDVNNVYVTCRNHDLDPAVYMDEIPYDRVVQIHIAGHADKGTHCIDTHGDHVCDQVWELYREAIRRTGGCSTLLEWDTDIPPFEVVFAELEKAPRYHPSSEVAP